MRYFDDFVVGERHDIPATYDMTEDEIVSFASKWDPQPFHIDREAAANSIYGTLTAAGTHIQAVVLFLAARLPEETAVLGALGYDEVRFHRPARGPPPGQPIRRAGAGARSGRHAGDGDRRGD